MYYPEVDFVKNQLLEKYYPEKLYLFGSFARGLVKRNSDIDICIVVNTHDKRALREDILMGLQSERDVDIVVYTPQEWLRYKDDPSKFCYLIANKGVNIYG